ncbi:EAL domain-containing protein [Pediococcus siamensis]|uniref:EAL domain-containing protein n=1 Tax=Pediococcus siamensis TaxID=381829 RepID=UPI00399FC2D9
MIRFWGQPKLSRKNLQLMGLELFLRQKTPNGWQLPEDFGRFTPQEISDLLIQTALNLDSKILSLSLNLDPEQFIDPQFWVALKNCQQHLGEIKLEVELTEHPAKHPIDSQQIIQAAQKYYEAGIPLIIDDVGSEDNRLTRVLSLNPFVQEYKFAIQNFRQTMTMAVILQQLSFWCDQAVAQHKFITVEGIESQQDLSALQDYPIDMVQGYGLGKPTYLATIQDTNLHSLKK